MKKTTLGYKIKKHLVDSTALLIVGTPVYGAVETLIAGMNNTTSYHARMLGGAIIFAGAGSLYTKGMDLSRKFFGVEKK